MSLRSAYILSLLALGLVSGCAPSLSPLYRDYEVVASRGADGQPIPDEVHARLRTALRQAGWKEAEPAAPNVLSTRPRSFGSWGIYEVTVSLDVVPLGQEHVRVHLHPLRRYLTGGRTKVPSLSGSLRQAILPSLDEALEAHGFERVGTPRERDDVAVDGT